MKIQRFAGTFIQVGANRSAEKDQAKVSVWAQPSWTKESNDPPYFAQVPGDVVKLLLPGQDLITLGTDKTGLTSHADDHVSKDPRLVSEKNRLGLKEKLALIADNPEEHIDTSKGEPNALDKLRRYLPWLAHMAKPTGGAPVHIGVGRTGLVMSDFVSTLEREVGPLQEPAKQ